MIAEKLNKEKPDRKDLIHLLRSTGEERSQLLSYAAETKKKHVGNKVYLRGLVELSNICAKNCYYCGIRKGNSKVKRYNITDEEVIDAARFAHQSNYGSVVIQSGEMQGRRFTERIEKLLKCIKEISGNELGITLSCGEQKEDVYRRWFEAGAHRYLLRIETSDKELYGRLHPSDALHSFEKRVKCLNLLNKCGYQTGTGVMVGLPFQQMEHLANDLIFMKEMDIDMCGMGPYIEHPDTPLYAFSDSLLPLHERFDLTMKMVAILRIMMPDINIASTTALQAIDKAGREKVILAGANILMPNITPGIYRDHYSLYENKPCTLENADDCKNCIDARIRITGHEVGYGEWGDSLHYRTRQMRS